MKVIVAGYPKTGTKSMQAALTALGYNDYDFAENAFYLREEYKKVFNHGWSTEDFRRMYENVDAVTDLPACLFWEQIHEAFPDAKIILTMRENEDVWYRSLKKHFEGYDNNIRVRLVMLLSPASRSMMQDIGLPCMALAFGVLNGSIWSRRTALNEQLAKMKYRCHNSYVIQTAPSDQLLVYKCSEGWGPLCKFLGVPEPSGSFPHKNVRGSIVTETLDTHTAFARIRNEAALMSAVLLVISAVSGYGIYRYGARGIIRSFCGRVSNLLVE